MHLKFIPLEDRIVLDASGLLGALTDAMGHQDHHGSAEGMASDAWQHSMAADSESSAGIAHDVLAKYLSQNTENEHQSGNEPQLSHSEQGEHSESSHLTDQGQGNHESDEQSEHQSNEQSESQSSEQSEHQNIDSSFKGSSVTSSSHESSSDSDSNNQSGKKDDQLSKSSSNSDD